MSRDIRVGGDLTLSDSKISKLFPSKNYTSKIHALYPYTLLVRFTEVLPPITYFPKGRIASVGAKASKGRKEIS